MTIFSCSYRWCFSACNVPLSAGRLSLCRFFRVYTIRHLLLPWGVVLSICLEIWLLACSLLLHMLSFFRSVALSLPLLTVRLPTHFLGCYLVWGGGDRTLTKAVNRHKESGYEISFLMAKHSKPFSHGLLVKECMAKMG